MFSFFVREYSNGFRFLFGQNFLSGFSRHLGKGDSTINVRVFTDILPMKLTPPPVLCFSHSGERETRVARE